MTLWEELTALDGVSGCETAVRKRIEQEIATYCDSVTVDSMGNLVAFCKGTKSDQKVLLSAHMDEVGFVVSRACDNGFLQVQTVGGFDPRLLPGTRVRLGEEQIPGVIGAKAVHLTSEEERETPIPLSKLYLDIGAKSKGEAERFLGCYATFDSSPVRFGDGLLKAKALDDRVGCGALIRLLQQKPLFPFDLYVCFAVQEEIGLCGARAVAERLQPDIGIVMEATTCADKGGGKPHELVTCLGEGPALSILDGASYTDVALREQVMDAARKKGIPFQLKQSTSGGNDAGAIQLYGCARTLVISLPCRYIHSPVSVIDTKDLAAYETLLSTTLEVIA